MPREDRSMNKLVIAVALAAPFLLNDSSQARPPYPALFMDEYKANVDVVKAAKAAKCKICHDVAGKFKNDCNEYGQALGRHITGADYKMLKADLAAKVSAAFKEMEKEKNAAGMTFGDIIKSGKLP
jgi:hypothetical protein